MIATVDQLSAGRVTPGIGAGWYRPEFEAFSSWDDASTRFRKTREGVKLMLRLWSEPIVDFSGKYYSTKGAGGSRSPPRIRIHRPGSVRPART